MTLSIKNVEDGAEALNKQREKNNIWTAVSITFKSINNN